jgi:hypothetical protein
MVNFPSMIVDDLNVRGARRSFGPTKTDSPLIVDANRKLPDTIAFECLQPIARQRRQISNACCGIEPVKAHLGLPRKARELFDVPPRGKPRGSLVSTADNHGSRYNSINYDLRK